MFTLSFVTLIVLAGLAYIYGSREAFRVADGYSASLHSRPSFHGAHLALWTVVPALIILMAWAIAEPGYLDKAVIRSAPANVAQSLDVEQAGFVRDVRALAFGGSVASPTAEKQTAADELVALRLRTHIILGLVLSAAVIGGFLYGRRFITREFRARRAVERLIMLALMASSGVAILTTFGIVLSVLFETLRFFSKYPPLEFFFGLQWSPQMAMRADQVGGSGAFGLIPVLGGTMLIMVIAMLVAGPVGLFAAIYMSEYASPRFRAFAKPILEVLAGIPTVVFGFFAALTVAPLLRDIGQMIGLHVASESALAAGLVMGVMIIPFISSLSDDVINSVPQSLRDGSYAMGATKSETIRNVVLPAALPGVMAAFMLAMSRAVGETMIVVMAAGLAANLTINPLEAVTTMTVQIKNMLVGDQEFDSVKTLSAFALGFVLFFFTLMLNIIALQIVKKYREQYD